MPEEVKDSDLALPVIMNCKMMYIPENHEFEFAKDQILLLRLVPDAVSGLAIKSLAFAWLVGWTLVCISVRFLSQACSLAKWLVSLVAPAP